MSLECTCKLALDLFKFFCCTKWSMNQTSRTVQICEHFMSWKIKKSQHSNFAFPFPAVKWVTKYHNQFSLVPGLTIRKMFHTSYTKSDISCTGHVLQAAMSNEHYFYCRAALTCPYTETSIYIWHPGEKWGMTKASVLVIAMCPHDDHVVRILPMEWRWCALCKNERVHVFRIKRIIIIMLVDLH